MFKPIIRYLTYDDRTLPEGRAMGKDAGSKLYWGNCCYHGVSFRYTSNGQCVKCKKLWRARKSQGL